MRKLATRGGWHPADIKAAVEKAGGSLRQLSLANELPEHSCRHALYAPCFAAELVIAEFLGMSPRELWPERYNAEGQTRHPPRTLYPRSKSNPVRGAAHCQNEAAA
jgi:Ner family transcriptional regulator